MHKVKKLQDKSTDELQEIAKLTRIKNYDNLSKEDLILVLLRSESNPAECSYMRYLNNNSNDEIKIKINDIRLILSRLGNIVTKNDRKKNEKDLYEIDQRQRLYDNEKIKIYNDLIKLADTLYKKEENKHSDHDNLDCFGIREPENLFANDYYFFYYYYKPVSVKNFFK